MKLRQSSIHLPRANRAIVAGHRAEQDTVGPRERAERGSVAESPAIKNRAIGHHGAVRLRERDEAIVRVDIAAIRHGQSHGEKGRVV